MQGPSSYSFWHKKKANKDIDTKGNDDSNDHASSKPFLDQQLLLSCKPNFMPIL